MTSSLSGTRSNQLSYTPGDGWLGRASGAEGVRSRSAWAADDAKQGEAAHGSGPFEGPAGAARRRRYVYKGGDWPRS